MDAATNLNSRPAVQSRQHLGQRRILWLPIFAAILIGGFLLAATGYRHALPYIDMDDEMTGWAMGRAVYDPSFSLYQPQFPPGLLLVHSTIQKIQIAQGDPFPNVGGEIAVMRLLSLMLTMISLVLVMVVAYRMAGPLAATVAGLLWAVHPLINFRAKIGSIDPWLWATFMISIAAFVEGWHRKSIR